MRALSATSRAPDDNESLDRAIMLHYSEITSAVARRGHANGSEYDIVHDLYLKLSAQPGVLRGKNCVVAFLCRAAINLGIDRIRRQSFETRLFSGSETEAQTVIADIPAPGHHLEVEDRLRTLATAISELPARRRAVFVLHRLHQLTPDQIADQLSISRNMVDRHLRKALAHCLNRLIDSD